MLTAIDIHTKYQMLCHAAALRTSTAAAAAGPRNGNDYALAVRYAR